VKDLLSTLRDTIREHPNTVRMPKAVFGRMVWAAFTLVEATEFGVVCGPDSDSFLDRWNKALRAVSDILAALQAETRAHERELQQSEARCGLAAPDAIREKSET